MEIRCADTECRSLISLSCTHSCRILSILELLTATFAMTVLMIEITVSSKDPASFDIIVFLDLIL